MSILVTIIFMAVSFVGGFVFGSLYSMSMKLKGKAFGTIRVIEGEENDKYAAVAFSDPNVEETLENNDYVILKVIKN